MNKQEYVNYIKSRYDELENATKEKDKKGNQIFWTFTNYPANFYENIKSANIFSKWKTEDTNLNLETYYTQETGQEHRRLIIDKLYGLMTCNSPTGYTKENTTPVYDNIIQNFDNKNILNKIISEQVLKVKINPIAGKDKVIDRSLYPVLFTYQVLRELSKRGKTYISLLDFYIVVCTQNTHDDITNCVELLLDNEQCYYPSEFNVRFLADKNRILGFFDNIHLFIYNKDKISLNTSFIDIMDNFLECHQEIFEILVDMDNYKTFLCNLQKFNISLIDTPIQEEFDEYIYNQSVENSVKKLSDSELNNITNNYKRSLAYLDTKTKTKINPETQYSIAALQKYAYKCCANNEHITFTSKSHGNQYMEAHHLIPRKYQQLYYDELNVNIDCVQNLVSLCPNCHRTLHHGIFAEKEEVLKALYELKKDDLESIGIKITLDTLMSYYI